MLKTDEQLKQESKVIRDEIQPSGNTKLRVSAILDNIIDSKINKEDYDFDSFTTSEDVQEIIGPQLNSINSQIEGIEEQVGPLSNRMNVVEQESSDAVALVGSLQSRTGALEGDVSSLDGRVGTVEDGLTNKVDKVAGKGLSSEDYTSDEKSKLSGIEAGAQVNTVSPADLATKYDVSNPAGYITEEDIPETKFSVEDFYKDENDTLKVVGTNFSSEDFYKETQTVEGEEVEVLRVSVPGFSDIPMASPIQDGKLSKEDFVKLSGIEEGAEVNQTDDEIINMINSREGEGRIDANTALKNGTVLSGDDFVLNVNDEVEIRGTELNPDHFEKTGNVISLNPDVIGGGGADPVPMASPTTDGKMSKEDFVKLSGIEDNATSDQTAGEIIALIESVEEEENKLSANALKDNSVLSGDDFILNPTTQEIEIKGSELNPSQFEKIGEVISIKSDILGEDTPMADADTDGKISKEDFVKLQGIEVGAQVNTVSPSDLDLKVDKVAGKGLSTNDFTNSEKSKLEGIEEGATSDQTPAEIIAAISGVTNEEEKLSANVLKDKSLLDPFLFRGTGDPGNPYKPTNTKQIKSITSTTYTLQEDDVSLILHFTSSDPITLNVPAGLTNNPRFEGRQLGTGQITFVGASGVVLNKVSEEELKTSGQFSTFSIDWMDEDEYIVYGKLELI